MGLTTVTAATVSRLTTLARVSAELGEEQDPVLDRMIDQASDAIATYCGRTFGREKLTETLPGTGRRLLGLTQAPLITVHEVLEDDVPLTDYVIEDAKVSALARDVGWWPSVASGWDRVAYDTGYIFPRFQRWRYVVTYTAGFILPEEAAPVAVPPVKPTLPGGVERACIDTVKAWWEGRTGVLIRQKRITDAAGGLAITYNDIVQGDLPPGAKAMLAPWRRGLYAAAV